MKIPDRGSHTRWKKKINKIFKRKIKRDQHEKKELKKLFLWYYQMRKAIEKGQIFTDCYNENMAKKIIAFLKGWNIGIVLYAKN